MKTQDVFVVDGNMRDLQTMKDILEKEGHKVVTESNFNKALEKIENNKFDLCIMAVRQSDIISYKILRFLKGKNDGTKIIVVSIDPKRYIELHNTNGFIQKPFTPESFINEINRVLSS